ncbi:MAG: hypothetical protein AAF993_05650 [Pseudomonadota bacterium]
MSNNETDNQRYHLGQWLVRDVLIIAGLLALWHYCNLWYVGATGIVAGLAALLTAVLGFISAYVSCYIVHEWGHYAGARLAGAVIPIGTPRGIALGLFNPYDHSVRQFQSMSWGGVVGYTLTAIICVSLYQPTLAYQALAVGGIAFVMQSWSVDLPIILRIQRGAPVLPTASDGASAAVIGRRTLQSWSVLTVGVVIWALA